MRDCLDRQMFEIVIQAAIGSRVVARETLKVSSYRVRMHA